MKTEVFSSTLAIRDNQKGGPLYRIRYQGYRSYDHPYEGIPFAFLSHQSKID